VVFLWLASQSLAGEGSDESATVCHAPNDSDSVELRQSALGDCSTFCRGLNYKIEEAPLGGLSAAQNM